MAFVWRQTNRLSSGNDLTVLGEKLRDHVAIVDEYERDEVELARQAGPAALPLLQRALRARNSPGYARIYDWLQGRLNSHSLTKTLGQRLPSPERDAERTRAGAARMLEALGEDAAAAADSLVLALDDESELVRLHSSLALLRLGGYEREVTEGQRRWLMENPSRNPTAAAFVLAQMGPPARAELPLLIPLMSVRTNSDEIWGRLCLPWILAQEPLNPPAHSFSELFRRTPRNLDDAGVWRLVDSARQAAEAEFFRDLLSNETNETARGLTGIRADDALGIAFMGSIPSNLVATLKAQLSSPDSDRRFAAGFAWWHLTGDARGSAQAMRTADLKDDRIFQLAFLLTMCDLGESAAPAAPKLAGFLTNSVPLHRRLAARSLGKVGDAALFTIPQLERSLADECLGLRLDAAESLWNLKNEANLTLPPLTELLDDSSPRRRGQAARLLQIMGPTVVPPGVLEHAQAIKLVEPDPFPSVFELLTRMLGQSGAR